MKVSKKLRLGRLVAAALVIVALVVVPSWVAADGKPDEPTPGPITFSDLSAPAEVGLTLVATSFIVLDATAY